MANRVGIAKAARLLGMSRATLQKLIRSGELPTFEGQVDYDELRERFPALAFNQSPEVERARIIKDTAFGERVQERVAPTTDSLNKQIRRLKVDLNIERTKARQYQKLIEDMLAKISVLDGPYDNQGDDVLQQLNAWLLEQFNNKKI